MLFRIYYIYKILIVNFANVEKNKICNKYVVVIVV